MEDAERIAYVTRNFERLQGLRYVPFALVVVFLGVGHALLFGTASGSPGFRPVVDLVPAGLVVVAMVLHGYIGGYYDRRFGRVRRRHWSGGGWFDTAFWVLIAAVFVLSFFRGWLAPIWLTLLAGAAVAAFLLGDRWVERHRLTVHWVFLAVLAVGACFLPVFGVPEQVAFSLVAVFLGCVLLVGSLLDHLLLARTLRPVPEEDDADAARG